MLKYNTELLSLTWDDHGSEFVDIPQALAQILAHAGCRHLQRLVIRLDPRGSDAQCSDTDVKDAWAPFAHAINHHAFPSLKSLAVRWICRGPDFSKILCALLPSRLELHIEAAGYRRSV
jgi:hypothetical protein